MERAHFFLDNREDFCYLSSLYVVGNEFILGNLYGVETELLYSLAKGGEG